MAEQMYPARWTPTPGELADTELLLDGSLAPLAGFMTAAELDSVRRHGQLPDATPWRAEVTLKVPAQTAAGLNDDPRLDLTDPEGTPIARLSVTDRATPAPSGAADTASEDRDEGADDVRLGGPLTPLQPREDGVFRDLRRAPEQVRESLGTGKLLAATVDAPLSATALAELAERATAYAGVVLLPLLTGQAHVLSQVGLVQATLAASRSLPGRVEVVPLAVGTRPREQQDWLFGQLGAAYADDSIHLSLSTDLAESTRSALERDTSLPVEFPDPIASVLRVDRPPLHRRGAVILLTGLSGSGKSTVARRLRDLLLERGDRTVTLLDGDVVRRMLSSGLGFSRADRLTNIRRIGYVAAEVARHGGLALCAPIAPYADVRADLRAMATEAGAGFVLVHVATPLAECERRDRKGLYAKARAGEIAEFTGISDPYEEPNDADLRIDTTDVSVDDAAARVVQLLREQGWLT